MFKAFIVSALLATAAYAPAEAASLLTSNAGYTGPGLDLSAYANGSYNFTFGPVAVDSFTFTSNNGGGNSGLGSVVGQGSYGLGGNGNFGGNAVYIGVDSGRGYAQLLGKTGYDQIGFFINYAPNNGGDDAFIATLDAAGNVIDSFDIETLAPVSTPGGNNAFAFRGVAGDPGSIYGLRFGGNYILLTGTANGVPPSVPEPATWAMMMTGFGLVGSAMRRRTTKLQTA